ncbi:hypothetical protein SAMN05660330_03836 [Desulforhopalus singaporensis]|uniref:Uncharacterized protein n=1 Tax=Desulforhopalus singaporensis TaxID=91360 RepID=A0A1H0V1Y1_9BACT|nr:hypothetical protein SAMN05660330_03836 [Desulforhopalus singaporensis]
MGTELFKLLQRVDIFPPVTPVQFQRFAGPFRKPGKTVVAGFIKAEVLSELASNNELFKECFRCFRILADQGDQPYWPPKQELFLVSA